MLLLAQIRYHVGDRLLLLGHRRRPARSLPCQAPYEATLLLPRYSKHQLMDKVFSKVEVMHVVNVCAVEVEPFLSSDVILM